MPQFFDPMANMNGGGMPIDAMMAAGVAPERIAAIQRQLQIANAMRHGQGPQMRNAGRVNVAANPLEFIGDIGQKYRASQRLKELRDQEQAQMDVMKEGREKYGRAYMDMMQPRQQVPQINPQLQMQSQGRPVPGIDPRVSVIPEMLRRRMR